MTHRLTVDKLKIDWETWAENEGFDSPKSMLQYYVIRTGTFKGTAAALGIDLVTLKRLRMALGLASFLPKDYYAWTRGYTSMHELVQQKMNEGLGSRRIAKYVEGFVSNETIKLIMRKINERQSPTLRYSKGTGRRVAEPDRERVGPNHG